MGYQQQPVDKSVFRAYDIRGIVGDKFNENSYYSIGRAIACRLIELGRNQIFVGRDGRLTSDSLAAALKQGLLDSGVNVIDLGCVATPVMYYATSAHATDSGVMITGSHNPADYNGVKMVLAGKTLAEADIEEIYQLVFAGTRHDGKGHCETLDIIPEYTARILGDIKLERPLKVVVDCGNGVAGPVIPKVIAQLGCEVIPLFCEIDGRFPNHHPDPTIEANLSDLKKAVELNKADIGLAFDGDADRLGVITNQGELIWPDRLMMLYAQEVLGRNKGATVVYDVKCSANLAKVIEASGGVAKMCPTGHSIVKGVMKTEQAVLAGEMSGHLFFKDRWYGFDDALYSGCRLLEILSRDPRAVSQQFLDVPNSVNTPEIKINIDDDRKFDFMRRFAEKAQFPHAKIVRIDGLRIEFPNGWGLIRASNTTPCLVARFEGENEAAIQAIQATIKIELLKIDSQLDIPF